MTNKHLQKNKKSTAGLPGSVFSVRKTTTGFTLIETIIYICIFALILIALVQTIISVNKSYGAIKSNQALEMSASDSLNRMSRDIRNATSIVMASSSFNSHPGRLTLNSKDGSGVVRTVEYYIDGSKMLQIIENGVSGGKLTSSSTPVSNLVFRLIDTGNSSAIKIDLSLQVQKNKATTTESFSATYVLRGSY